MSQQCEECDDAPVAFICQGCEQNLCASCEQKLHKKGRRVGHKRTPISPDVRPPAVSVTTTSSSPIPPVSPSSSSSGGQKPLLPRALSHEFATGAGTRPLSPTGGSLGTQHPLLVRGASSGSPAASPPASSGPPASGPPGVSASPRALGASPPASPRAFALRPVVKTDDEAVRSRAASATPSQVALPGMAGGRGFLRKGTDASPKPPPWVKTEGGAKPPAPPPDEAALPPPPIAEKTEKEEHAPDASPKTAAPSDGEPETPKSPPAPPEDDSDSDDDRDGAHPPPPPLKFEDTQSAALGAFAESLRASAHSTIDPPTDSSLSKSSSITEIFPGTSAPTQTPTSPTSPYTSGPPPATPPPHGLGVVGAGSRPGLSPRSKTEVVPPKASIAPKSAPPSAVKEKKEESSKQKCHDDHCMSFAVRSGFCLRHVWKLGYTPTEPSRQEKIAREIISTERSYQQGLGIAVKRFLKGLEAAEALEKPLLTKEQMTQIFHNIEDIYQLSSDMAADLEEMKEKPYLLKQIGLTLLHYSPRFRLYQSYLENYDNAIKGLSKLREANEAFDFFMKLNEKAEGLTFESYLVMPIQRLPRYLLLLKELIKHTPETDPDIPDMNHAHDKIKRIADAINSSLHQKIAADKVKMLEDMFERDERFFELASPTRSLLKQGELTKRFSKKSLHISSTKDYTFFLFNDILIYASPSRNWKSGGGPSYKMKHVLPLSDMKVKEIWGPKNKSKDIQLLVGKREWIISCPDPATHMDWLKAITDAIDHYNKAQTERPVERFDGGDGGVVRSSKLEKMLSGKSASSS